MRRVFARRGFASRSMRDALVVVRCVFVLLLLFDVHDTSVEGKLIMTTTLTRHGTRAPNPVVTSLCPGLFNSTTRIITAFGAAPGHLTQNGIEAMRDIGKWIRKEYIDRSGFMPHTYTDWGSIWSFRAIQEHRHLTSASAIAQGIFPNQPVAIFSSPKVVDNLLATPPAACVAETRAHILAWLAVHGETYFRTNSERSRVVAEMNQICRSPHDKMPLEDPAEVSTIVQNREKSKFQSRNSAVRQQQVERGPLPIPGNPHPAFQDVCDLFNFMHDQGIDGSPGSAIERVRKQCTAISLDMMQRRMYADDATIARFCGLFPRALVDSMRNMLQHLADVSNRRSTNDPDFNEEPRFTVYVASRELLYGLAHYFDLQFRPVPGKPRNYIMAGTTFVWELHLRDGESASFEPENAFVRMFYFYPKARDRIPITIGDCPSDCPLHRFEKIVSGWTRRVGDLSALCPTAQSEKSAKKMFKKEEKDEKKLGKKMLESAKRAERQRSVAFRSAVESFERLVRAGDVDGRDWASDAHVVDAFCDACMGQMQACGASDDATSSSERDTTAASPRNGKLTMPSPSLKLHGKYGTVPHFGPVFASVVMVSIFVAIVLYGGVR